MKKDYNNFVCIIPARKGSKRIKNKNIVKINHKPLIEYTLDASIKVFPLKNIFVSTNDKKIIDIAKKYNINFIRRPNSLCKDNTSSEKSILHAIKTIETNRKIQHIVFLQVTSPLRSSNDIIRCICEYKNKKLDSIFSAYKVKRFIWTGKKKISSLTFDYKKRQRSQNLKDLIIENGAIFIFNLKKFLKAKNRIFGKFDYFEMEEEKSFDIDELKDLKLVRKLLN
jgi:CMP-N-acetylneuraminic acid synthetase